MRILAKEQILLLHSELIKEFGGSDGLRDEGLLDSALAAPFQSFDGEDMLATIQQKAARLGFGLVKNHPFVDGNKRIGTHAMLMFLAMNGIELAYTQADLSNVTLKVAAGEIGFEGLVEWIRSHEA
jgi:death-on-curing protein